MKTKLGLLLIAIIAMSCGKKAEETFVTFETPQPVNKSDIKQMPKRLLGKYSPLNPSLHYFNVTVSDTCANVNDSSSITYDSSVLQIRRDLIVETRISHYVKLLDSADRVELHDTTFAIDEYGVSSHVVIKGDSSYYHMMSKDTLYSSLRGDLLRKFKGYYFLNQKIQDGKWFVRKLSKFKGGLIIGTISSIADIDKLKIISESVSDTAHNFKLTRKQFKEFVAANGFTDEDVFIKME